MCRKINGKYAYPRAQLHKKYDAKYDNLCKYFKYKNRYYCYIDNLFNTHSYNSCDEKAHLFYIGVSEDLSK